MNRRHLFLFFIICTMIMCGYTSYAKAQKKQDSLSITQEETSIPALEIYSTYQPTTLLSGKVLLKPQLLKTNNIDTLIINYKIRPSSLIIPYEPTPINPLAYEVVEKPTPYENYFSLFSGNTFLNIPKMRLSIGLGNGKNTHFRIYASHTAQRGNLNKIPFQQYRTVLIKAFGSIATQHTQMKMGLETEQLKYFKYGIQNVLPPQGAFTSKDLQNYLHDYRAYFKLDAPFRKVLLRLHANLHYTLLNTITQETNPDLLLTLESSHHKEKTHLYWQTKAGYRGNFLHRKEMRSSLSFPADTLNHIIYAEGGMHYRYKTIGLDLAVNVSYSPNGKRFYYLPLMHFFHKINQDIAILHLGWEERLQLNNLRSLYQYNHWLNTHTAAFYTTTYLQKWYLGLSGSWKNVWDYDFQVFFKMHHQLPLMVNAFNELQSFQVLPAPLVRGVGVRLNTSYKFGNKIRLSAYLLNQNYPFKNDLKFGLSPLETSLNSYFKVLRVLTLQVGLLWKIGGMYLLNADGSTTKDGQIFTDSIGKIPNYLDLNFSLRARVTSSLELYTTLSNILNRPNPLWLYYNEIPFSIGGGIILHFNTQPKKKKLQNNQP